MQDRSIPRGEELQDGWVAIFQAAKEMQNSSDRKASDRGIAIALGSEDYRSAVRAYRTGTRRPKNAAQAWRIGEALKQAGVDWASGPVALYADGRLTELVDFIAALSQCWVESSAGAGYVHRQRAGQLALVIVALLQDGVARAIADNATTLAALYHPVAFAAAWERISSPGPKTVRYAQAPDLRLARAFAEADLAAEERQDGIAQHLLRWVQKTDPHMLFGSPSLIIRSVQRSAYAEIVSLRGLPPQLEKAALKIGAEIRAHRASKITQTRAVVSNRP